MARAQEGDELTELLLTRGYEWLCVEPAKADNEQCRSYTGGPIWTRDEVHRYLYWAAGLIVCFEASPPPPGLPPPGLCAAPYEAIQNGCPGAPAVSYIWSDAEGDANVRVALKNVAESCINKVLPATPCAAHHEGVPPLFQCIFSHKGTGAEFVSELLRAEPVVRTMLADSAQPYTRVEPILTCPLPKASALAAVFKGAALADLSSYALKLSVRFLDLELAFDGEPGGDVVAAAS